MAFRKRKSRKNQVPSRVENLVKSTLDAKKHRSSINLKEVRIVLHDIRFSHLIPEHQRHLLTKQNVQSVGGNNETQIKKNSPQTEKEPIKYIEVARTIEVIATGKENEETVSQNPLDDCTTPKRCATRKRKISPSNNQKSSGNGKGFHPVKLLRTEKSLRQKVNKHLNKVLTILESSESETISTDCNETVIIESSSTISSFINNSTVPCTDHIDRKSVKPTTDDSSSASDACIETDSSTNSLPSKPNLIRHHSSSEVKPSTNDNPSERRTRRIISLSSSNEPELIQIVQADTTVHTNNEEKKATPESDVCSTNCNDASVNSHLDKILDGREVQSTSQDPSAAAGDNNKKTLEDIKQTLGPNVSVTTGANIKKKIRPRIMEELLLVDSNISIISPKDKKVSQEALEIQKRDIKILEKESVREEENLTGLVVEKKTLEKKVPKASSKRLGCATTRKPVGHIKKNTNMKIGNHRTKNVSGDSVNLLTCINNSNDIILEKTNASHTVTIANCKILPEEKKEAVDASKINANVPMQMLDCSIRKSKHCKFSSQLSKDNSVNTPNNTNHEPPQKGELSVGTLTTENINKHVESIRGATTLRKYIEETSNLAISNSSKNNPMGPIIPENKDKPVSSVIKRSGIKLIRKKFVSHHNTSRATNDRAKQEDSQVHEMKKSETLHQSNKAVNEHTETTSRRSSSSLRKMNKAKKNSDGLVQNIAKLEEKEMASKNITPKGLQKCVERRHKSIEICNGNNTQEHFMPCDEKSSAPLKEITREDTFLKPFEKECYKEEIIARESEDDDCISLFADTFCFSDDGFNDTVEDKNDTPDNEEKSVWSNNVQCNIVGSSNFDAYVKKNLSDFDKEYERCEEQPDLRTVLTNKKKKLTEENNNIVPLFDQPPCAVNPHEEIEQLPTTSIPPLIPMQHLLPKCISGIHWGNNGTEQQHVFEKFRGCCYLYLAGKCVKRICRYIHGYPPFLKNLYIKNPHEFWEILRFVIFKDWRYLAVEIVLESLPAMTAEDIMATSRKLYKTNYLNAHLIATIVDRFLNNGMPIYDTIRQFTFIEPYDTHTWQYILPIIQRNILPGEFWNTVKPLLQHVRWNTDYVEAILHECIQNQKNYFHIQEVHRDLINSLDSHELSYVSSELLSNFHRLLEQQGRVGNIVDGNVAENVKKSVMVNVTTLSLPSENTARTVEARSTSSSSYDTQRTETDWQTSRLTARDPNKCKKQPTDVRSNTSKEKDEGYQQPFKIQRIDDLPPPQSLFRGMFTKFYEDLNGLKMGLQDRNYDYVIDILNRAASSDKISFYTHSCYQILRAEIKHSQEHLTQIIERTVLKRMYPVLYEMLQDITMRIIIDLVDEAAWVLAYKLLKILHVYMPKFDAAFILLSAEIYLANRLPLKALALLRQHNLICTNRSKWYVDSNETNEYHRAEIISLLLEALCWESPEHACVLFQFLCADQVHNFQPIDLTGPADRIMSILLSTNNDDMIVTMGRFIIDYNFTLRPITFRATIVTLVHTDSVLARQMYQYAVRLGVYSTAQFSSIVTLTINAAWTEEEMYLAMSDLLDQLSKNIGPAIEHLKPANLKIYLSIENVPIERRLYSDESKTDFNSKVNKSSRIMLQHILAKRFDPSLRIAERGKYCRMITTSVAEYLKAQHCN